MKTLIFAGGSGTRLWPLSWRNYPKKFLELKGGSSLLHQTVERMTRAVSAESVLVLTTNDY